MKNRKLFPALTDTNQTIECPDFCDPACPYNCYPYHDYYYYYLSPPPPPPPPPPLSDQNHYISPFVIVFVSVLASFFLLVGYYVIIVKSCFGWCCSRNNYNSQPQPQTDVDEELLDENRVDHPIWFITTVGLQQSIINSITICKYKKGEGLIEGTECSVCLNEFQEDETVRLLPKCNHAFHISCIDTWLRAHTNCPLCRAHILFDAVCAPPSSADQNSDHNVDLAVENQREISEIGLAELSGQNQGRSADTTASELPEANNDRRISKNGVYSDENGASQLVDKAIQQQIKRCVSMDSSSAASLFLGLPKQDGVNSSEFRVMGDSSIADQHLHLSPVTMKRSLSCGGRFFSSKRYRSMNSILPL
ncbi:hypothetical protein PTKIN_Ptkin01aG0045500 [Pterospermum kingtungense]